MSKKLESILKKLESEKNQNFIKRFNSSLSLIAIFFILRIYSEYSFTDFKFTYIFILALIMQIIFLFTLFSIWRNFLLNNNVDPNTSFIENWSQANVNKYIPGGIGLSITRFSISKNLSKDSKKIFFGMVEDQTRGAILVLPFMMASFFFESFVEKNFLYLFTFIISLFLIFKVSNVYSTKLNFKSLFNDNLSFITFSCALQIAVNFIILSTLFNSTYSQLIYISILYFVSASLGLLFIGSPAGLGIREFIFYIYASNLLSSEIMLSYLFLVRVLSISADIVFYLISKLLIKLN